MCIIGDAAHGTTPWQGSGAGMAIEDAVILATLLGEISTPNELDHAFQAYDAVRRPRCQSIIDSSKGSGEMMCGRSASAGLDPQKLKQLLPLRWGVVVCFDMGVHKQDALEKLRELRGK